MAAWSDIVLETDRLRLRALRDTDRPLVLLLMTDPASREFLGGPVPEAHIEAVGKEPLGQRWGVFCISESATDNGIGICSFDRDRGTLEISFSLDPAAWHHGYAQEAITASLAWVWDSSNETSVIAVTQTANTRSLATLTACGFTPDRTFTEYGTEQQQLRTHRPGTTPEDKTHDGDHGHGHKH